MATSEMYEAPGRRVWMEDGEMYFSPNCVRKIKAPPKHGDQGYTPLKFVPGVTKATEFQEPRWWHSMTEWLAFVPVIPMPYQGYWFQALSPSPGDIVALPSGGFMLNKSKLGSWIKAEDLLCDVARILTHRNNFQYSPPCRPNTWSYDKIHFTYDIAEHNLGNAREWFAIWIGLLYWLTRKVVESSSFREGQTPPQWYIQVIQGCKERSTWDIVRTMPMLSHHWGWSRVGVWLRFPSDVPSQPQTQWFVERNIPVWYRWGSRETHALRTDPNFSLIPPSPEELQAATTFLTSAPFIPAPINVYSHSYNPVLGGSADSHFEVLDVSEIALDSHIESQSASTSTTSNNERNISKEAERAEKVWNDFWKAREAKHVEKLEKETPKLRQRRQQREKNPPETSAEVYEWEWSDEVPRRFRPKRVNKHDRQDEIRSYNRKGGIARYDSFFNEWHLTAEFLRNPYQHDDESDTDPEEEENSRVVASRSAKSANTKINRTQRHVLHLLTHFFGFVPPIPLPVVSTNNNVDRDCKFVVGMLGMDKRATSPEFFGQQLGIVCTSFLRAFLNKEKGNCPDAELWDLADGNRNTLSYSRRLSSLRSVLVNKDTWYMFDFHDARTVPWNLAVQSAAAALYVCRLDDAMSEEDIALDLAQEGIPFRTLQHRDSLPEMQRSWYASTYVPMRLSGHVFDQSDHDFFRHQSREILGLPRARAAIMRGGFSRRIALEYISVGEVVKGPIGIYEDPAHMFVAKDRVGNEYIDDDLTTQELEVLCGLFSTFTGVGEQIAKVSWYPLHYSFEGSGDDLGRWTDYLELLWRRCNEDIAAAPSEKALKLPLNLRAWDISQLRGFIGARRAWKRVEDSSKKFISEHVGQL